MVLLGVGAKKLLVACNRRSQARELGNTPFQFIRERSKYFCVPPFSPFHLSPFMEEYVPRELEGEEYSPQVLQLCSRVYRWTCLNCTCPNSVCQPTAEMLRYCAALSARMAAQAELSRARSLHMQAMREYAERVQAWQGSGGGSSAAAVASSGGGSSFASAGAWESARGASSSSSISRSSSGELPLGALNAHQQCNDLLQVAVDICA